MKVLFIKGDDISNVRLSKFLHYFKAKGSPALFWGWDRQGRNPQEKDAAACSYLLKGGGFGGRKLILYYPIWMLVVFLKALVYDFKGITVIAVNFDSAFPVYLASRLRGFKYIYEIRDEFALSYAFPAPVKRLIQRIDRRIMRNARFVIHVDHNRVTYSRCRYVVIENSPTDAIQEETRDYHELTRTFAVIGNISAGRGIEPIAVFAEHNPGVKVLLVGKFYDERLKKRLTALRNVEYHDYMPQSELFKLLRKCCAIFSLYNPALEINRLAASNKVYDAMMLGIPVITNKEVVNSKFIEEQRIGLVIDYDYDETWKALEADNFLEKAKETGKRGRALYLREYQFDRLLDNRLLPLLEEQ